MPQVGSSTQLPEGSHLLRGGSDESGGDGGVEVIGHQEVKIDRGEVETGYRAGMDLQTAQVDRGEVETSRRAGMDLQTAGMGHQASGGRHGGSMYIFWAICNAPVPFQMKTVQNRSVFRHLNQKKKRIEG